MGILQGLKKLFDNEKENSQPENIAPEAESEGNKQRNINVTGTAHYERNLLKLAVNNPAFSWSDKDIARKMNCQNIYQYSFHPKKVELIPEPTNPHDPNAIKVVIDGELVGYVKSGSCSMILKLINENRIARLDAQITGGEYKNIWSDGNDIQQREKGRKSYHVKIAITEK